MNIPLTIAILALGLQFATAENVKTLTGQEYKEATITRAEPDGIVLMYSAGIVKIPFTELDPEWRKKVRLRTTGRRQVFGGSRCKAASTLLCVAGGKEQDSREDQRASR